MTGDTVVSCIIAQNVSLEDMEGLPADAVVKDVTEDKGDSAENSPEISDDASQTDA